MKLSQCHIAYSRTRDHVVIGHVSPTTGKAELVIDRTLEAVLSVIAWVHRAPAQSLGSKSLPPVLRWIKARIPAGKGGRHVSTTSRELLLADGTRVVLTAKVFEGAAVKKAGVEE